MDESEIKYFIESALLAAGRPLNIDQLLGLFDKAAAPQKSEIRQAIQSLQDEYQDRGMTIVEVASGFRLQIKSGMAERLHRLWEERPPRYSRALFETLALIAYRQPMTRGEIEEIRGVTVSTNIMRSLLEREWVRVVGHRDVPGRPAMFGTTRSFLDYFGLKKLDDLPPLSEISDWESLRVQLNLPAVDEDEEPQTAEITEIPVLYPENSAHQGDEPSDETEPSDADIPDIETALSEASEFEEIEVTEWPNPNEAISMVVHEGDDDRNGESPEDADASVTGT